MSSITLYPDVPCAYPTTLGENKATGIGNTPTPIACFRNNSSIPNLRAILQHFDFLPTNASDDTDVIIQMVGGVTATGGTWESITNSQLEINKTASVSGGLPSLTMFASVVISHGNTPASGSLTDINAEALGLKLPIGFTFAIYASTTSVAATTDLLWSVNWIEKD